MRSAPRRGGSPKAAFPAPLRDGEMLAALDLGSNSFHMVVAQRVLGQLRVVDRLRETVRMAEGLDKLGGLAPDARDRALDCLLRFGQRIADIPPQHVRAVATNTVRQLRAPESFLEPAERALGHAIDVVSGREEARLVYLGVAHEQPPKPGQQRLVSQPLQQGLAIRGRQQLVEAILGFGLADAGGYCQQVQIMVTEYGSGALAEATGKAQHLQ